MATDAWTPAMLAKMKAGLERGLSTAEIGKKIGMSKNAVVGKISRMGGRDVILGVKKAARPARIPEKPARAAIKKIKETKAAAAKKPVAKPAPKKAVSAKPAAKPVAKPMPKKAAPVKPAPAKPAPAPTPKSAPKSTTKTLAEHQRIIQHSLEMVALKPDQCRWPVGDPDSDNFHFCGKPVFVGKPYCYDHCLTAYQMQPPKKK